MFTKRILAVTDNKMFFLVCEGRRTYFELHLKQECTNPGCHITQVTFFTLLLHILLVLGNRNMLHIVHNFGAQKVEVAPEFLDNFLTLYLKYRVTCVYSLFATVLPDMAGLYLKTGHNQPQILSSFESHMATVWFIQMKSLL
jgi:hypothetical protein